MIVLKNLISVILATLYLLLILSCKSPNFSSDTAKHNALTAIHFPNDTLRHRTQTNLNNFLKPLLIT